MTTVFNTLVLGELTVLIGSGHRSMQDPRSYLGRGWRFPVRVHEKDGTIQMSEYDRDVKESIRIILSTSKGERVMRPDFGCGIYELVFDVVDIAMLTRVEN